MKEACEQLKKAKESATAANYSIYNARMFATNARDYLLAECLAPAQSAAVELEQSLRRTLAAYEDSSWRKEATP